VLKPKGLRDSGSYQHRNQGVTSKSDKDVLISDFSIVCNLPTQEATDKNGTLKKWLVPNKENVPIAVCNRVMPLPGWAKIVIPRCLLFPVGYLGNEKF